MCPVLSPDDQLEDFQRRYQLLEGEGKANRESYSAQIHANKETIKNLTQDNNKLRGELGSITLLKKTGHPDTDLIKLKGQYNKLRDANTRKSMLVEQLKGQLTVMSTHKSATFDDPNARRVRVLENRIDKAMIKFNEAQSIKKTYEGILKRLKDERIGFDHELADLEKQLQNKRKDYDELLLLSHDAQHAKEMAQAELHRFEQAVMEERNQRDREVMEKKLLVQQRIDMNHRLEKREKAQAAAVSYPSSTPVVPSPIEETQTASSSRHFNKTTDERAKLDHKLLEFEEGYKKLKEITGVSDVNEIIQKFITLDVTHANLVKETREQEAKLESLTRELNTQTAQLNEIKYSGQLTITNKKQAIEDVESLLQESSLKLEKNRARYDKLAQILIEVNAGVGHLSEKLRWIDVNNTRLGEWPNDQVVSDETVEEVLAMCESKVSKLVEVITNHISSSRSSDAALPMDSYSPDIRIKIPTNQLLDEGDFDATGVPGPTGMVDSDIFNRKLYKHNSEVFLDKIKRKQQQMKK